MRPLVLLFAVCLTWNASRALAEPASAHAKPQGLALTGRGSVLEWTGNALWITPSGGARKEVALPGPIIALVVPRPVDKTFVVVEKVTETERGFVPEHSVHLIDEDGSVLESWPMADHVLALVAPGRRAYALTTTGVVRLDPKAGRTELGPRDRREQQLFADSARQLIVCKSNDERESAPATEGSARAGCRSSAGWQFEGSWASVKPQLCGEWLVEPVQAFRARRTDKLRVRSARDASVVGEATYRTEELRCIGDGLVWDVSGRKLLALPNLAPRSEAKCEGKRIIAATARGDAALCIDETGAIQRMLPAIPAR